jgi:hypothetical protein
VNRRIEIVTNGAWIQVALNELSLLELKAIFAMLDQAIDTGTFPVPGASLITEGEAETRKDKAVEEALDSAAETAKAEADEALPEQE